MIDYEDGFAKFGRGIGLPPSYVAFELDEMQQYAEDCGGWDCFENYGDGFPTALMTQAVAAPLVASIQVDYDLNETPDMPESCREEHWRRIQVFRANMPKIVMAERALLAKPKSGVKLWLIDTGCGHDLIGKTELKACKALAKRAKVPIMFSTANGQTPANDVGEMFVQELGEAVEPYILEDTPAVLSVGMRCMQHNYTFVWPAGQSPYFLSPSGMIIACEVIDNIPYIRTGGAECQPKDPTGSITLAAPAAGGAGVPLHPLPAVPGPGGGADNNPLEMDVEEIPPPEGPNPEEMNEEEANAQLPKKLCESLRFEATSTKHLLTHLPRNPFCIHCTRAKMRKKKKMKGSYTVSYTHLTLPTKRIV